MLLGTNAPATTPTALSVSPRRQALAAALLFEPAHVAVPAMLAAQRAWNSGATSISPAELFADYGTGALVKGFEYLLNDAASSVPGSGPLVESVRQAVAGVDAVLAHAKSQQGPRLPLDLGLTAVGQELDAKFAPLQSSLNTLVLFIDPDNEDVETE